MGGPVIQVQAERNILVADSPQAIAQAVATMLTDDALRERIGQAGCHYVETHHDWHVVIEKLESVYREVIAEADYSIDRRPAISPA